MSNLIFFGIAALVVLTLLVFSVIKLGGVRQTITYFKDNGALRDWKTFVAIAIAIVLFLTVATNTKADEVEFFKYTEVSLGIDHVYNGPKAAACNAEGVSERLAGNGRVSQNILVLYDVDINIKYQHHSCALNRDELTYDAFGFEITKRWEW